MTEGYVGITSDMKSRMKYHRLSGKKTHLNNVKKAEGWENLIISIIAENIDKTTALDMENNLRPTTNIGWNLQKGGEIGVDASWYKVKENSEKHKKQTSVKTKLAIQNELPGARSARTKKGWENGKYSTISVKGSKNPNTQLTEDVVRLIKYDILPKKEKADAEIARDFGVTPYIIWAIKSNKNWKHV